VTAEPAATPKTKQTTEYVVLRENTTGLDPTSSTTNTHNVIKTVSAASANEAIRNAADNQPGIYRAIPARSFKPVKVTVHTETTIRLG
jgi:hypothetical protein